MNQWVRWLATLSAVGAALMTGMIGAWQALPLLTLGLRCLVAGILVFAFVRFGGDLAGRALLRSVAEHESRQNESRSRPDLRENEEPQPAEQRPTEQKAA